MPLVITAVGFAFPGALVPTVSIASKASLLDADIIVFRPSIQALMATEYTAPLYQGLPNLTDDSSFRLKDAANHWRQQLRLAVSAGKTVVIYLPTLQKVWVDSGQRQYSGTGRNRQTTRVVEPFDNYRLLPAFADEVIPGEGRQMKLTPAGDHLTDYWHTFAERSAYKVVLKTSKVPATIVTATGDLTVGTTFTMAKAKGTFVALPSLIAYDRDPEVENTAGKVHKRFGHELLDQILGIHRRLTEKGVPSPPPEWATQERFRLPTEAPLQASVLELDSQVEAAIKRKAELLSNLSDEGKLRALLYATGQELEAAILIALRLLGFTAEPVREGQSEFDAVFTSPEGRFLGEAEGKDNKAINVDKLRQLEMNIQEDFDGEGVTSFAIPVLFGNAYRLQPPADRPAQFFTDKCSTAAARANAVLVKTTDLFIVTQYLKGTRDDEYAKSCREALAAAIRKLVVFPAVPQLAVNDIATDQRS